jgi:phage tail-like protein
MNYYDEYPMTVFNFEVDFYDISNKKEELIWKGRFSECSGIEATMEPKSIKEGGQNYGDRQRVGRTTFSTVILKRGMTSVRNFSTWFETINTKGYYSYRLNVVIKLYDIAKNEYSNPRLQWTLKNAIPTKFKTADLNAKATDVGIEELHLVHEALLFNRI